MLEERKIIKITKKKENIMNGDYDMYIYKSYQQ